MPGHASLGVPAALTLTCSSWLLRPPKQTGSLEEMEKKLGGALAHHPGAVGHIVGQQGGWALTLAVSSSTESLMWLMISWFSSNSCSSCSMRFL